MLQVAGDQRVVAGEGVSVAVSQREAEAGESPAVGAATATAAGAAALGGRHCRVLHPLGPSRLEAARRQDLDRASRLGEFGNLLLQARQQTYCTPPTSLARDAVSGLQESTAKRSYA